MHKLIAALAVVGLAACAGSKGAAPSPTDASFSGEGVAVQRPESWIFVQPDHTLAADTLIVLQGPAGDEPLAPVVEISRRQLSAIDQRKKPAHLLTSLVTEVVQTFDGFDNVTPPADVTLGGVPAARVDLRFNDAQPDGTTVQRLARFYGVVHRDQMWVVRCIGPTNESHNQAFDDIVASLTFD